MSSPVHRPSFCRLCLSKANDKVDKVPVFDDGNTLDNLLQLIEIQIDPNDEPDAVVCLDCVVTLEGFYQFKEQCHVNDTFVKSISSKLDRSFSLTPSSEEEEDAPEGFLQEEDHLELSETEEILQEEPESTTESNEFNTSEKPSKRVKAPISKTSASKKHKPSAKSVDDSQILAESYPDCFHFEKIPRTTYYTLVFQGDRFNSPLYGEHCTYWQCIHRKKYQCPAQVCVTNDYKTFKRLYEHSHGKLPNKKGKTLTPHQILPEIFQTCNRIVSEKRKESFENKFQQFAANQSKKVVDLDERDSSTSESHEAKNGSRLKRKIKPSTKQNCPKTQPDVPKAKLKKLTIERSEPEDLKSEGTSKAPDLDEDEPEDDTNVEELLDLEKIEEECKALKVRKRAPLGPSLDEQLILADSYPDYFFFEKVPRSVNFSLVYYGERYHSAVFTEYYTYWTCKYYRKYDCPAQVRVTNNYKTFERRYEHTHPDIKAREGVAFTPLEALPKLFETCRKMVLRYRLKRRKQVLEKHRLLQIGKLKSSTKPEPSKRKRIEEVFVAIQDDSEAGDEEDESYEYGEELIKENTSQVLDDSEDKPEVASRVRPKRKIKRNSRYADSDGY